MKLFGLDLEKKKYTILDGFFPYLTQMITSMRRCVAYNDLWPWPISSRSFGLDLENRVLSVASTVLDGFFPYVVQMITSMRRCVACDDLWPWPISSRSFGLDLENRVLSVASTVLDGFFPYLVQMISSMRRCVACDDLWPWPISSRSFDLDFENCVRSVTFSVLDRLFFWLGIQYDSIMWVIMRRRGVSSERRRSSCSSYTKPSHVDYLFISVVFQELVLFLLAREKTVTEDWNPNEYGVGMSFHYN